MRTSLLACCAVVAACGASSRPELELERITPAGAPANMPVRVSLEGTFELEVRSNIDDGRIDVPALEVLLDDVPLDDVMRSSENLIEGTVPASLPPGRYDVIVRNGSRSAVLEGGYAVLGSGLVSTLAIPELIGRGNPFVVTMTVMNIGNDAATAVTPSVLVASGTGTAMMTTPAAGGASLAGGATATFEWTYTAQTVGTILFTGNATGVDELSGVAIESPVTDSNTADIAEATSVITDPLADGTPFGYVAGYRGRVYIGPNETGVSAVRVLPDGTAPEQLGFVFTRDMVDNASESSFNGTFKSIGFTGCTPNTAECGPDNENGRGLFTSGTIGGTEWLILGGAKIGGDHDYIYMTADDDTTLDFRYVDLDRYLGPNTRGFSAAHVHADRLYLGFPDAGGARPYLVAVTVPPPEPGLDAIGADAIDLSAQGFPSWQSASPAIVDSMTSLNGLLYVANHAGIMASTVMQPGSYAIAPTDWANATPAFLFWTSKTSRTTPKLADIEPIDRAVPQMAAFGGQLFIGRNTTTGPQLLACKPSMALGTRCGQGDWRLVAPNLALTDKQLTQFDNPALTSITMVVATASHLYVGFDGANGVTVFRTANPDATARSDFEGQGGCSAAQHPGTCNGLGGAGFGMATTTRILDAKALTFGTQSSVWVTAGDGSNALRLVVLP